MKHPTSKAVRKVADVFYDLVENDNHKYGTTILDMSEEQIVNDHCGTTACHAGWYLLAKTKVKHEWRACFTPEGSYYKKDSVFLMSKDKQERINYFGGCSLMARDLGFKQESELTEWAERNPDIWGNEYGRFMFTSPDAFRFPNGGEVTLEMIADHWQAVSDLLEDREEKNATSVK